MEMKQKQTLRQKLQGRTFRTGTYTVALCIVALAVAVIINVLVSRIPSSYTAIDMTGQDLYTLSDQTRQILDGLDQDVTVYVLSETGSEDDTIMMLLDQYKARSSHIKVISKDPVLYPGFAAQYTDQELASNSLIVESALRSQVVPYDEIYLYTYDSYYYYSYVSDVQFAGENALTSAVNYVTSAELPILYCLTGHGESVINDSLTSLIDADNLTLSDLSLLSSEGVPQDAGCLIVNNPQTDLSEDEAQMLGDYLEAGGRLLLVTDYTVMDSLSNLSGVLEAYGLTATSGLVLENDTGYCYRYRNYLLPSIETTDITAALAAGRYSIFAPNAHAVGALDSYRSSITVAPLLTTSDSAYVKADADNAATMEKEDGDETGPFSIAVAAQEIHDGVETRIVWFGTPYLMDESADAMVSGADSDLVLASLGWMAGSDASISIHTKTLTTEHLTVSDSAASLYSALFIGVIPALLLICGGVVLMRRRKR